MQATWAPRFAVAAARGIVYDIDVHSFRLDGAPRSSCHLSPSRERAAGAHGRSFVARVIATRGVLPGRLSTASRVTTRARQAHLMVKQQQCWLCCACSMQQSLLRRARLRGGACKRTLERFERPPVNSPTYVAGQPPWLGRASSSPRSPRAQPSRIDRETPRAASGSRIDASWRPLAARFSAAPHTHCIASGALMQHL